MQILARTAGDSFTLLFLDQLDGLNTRLGQGTAPGSDQMVRLEQTAALRDKLAKLRDSELYYSLDGEERYRSDWEMSMSELLAAIQALDLGEQQGNRCRRRALLWATTERPSSSSSTAVGKVRIAVRR